MIIINLTNTRNMDMKASTHDYDALILAIALAINSPDDEKAQQCIVMAQRLAYNPYTEHTLRALCVALLSKLGVERV